MTFTNNIDNNNKTKLILFAILIVTNPIPSDFIKYINVMFTKINNWFKASLLSLSFETPSFMPFLIKNNSNIDTNTGCEDKQIPNTTYIKFLGLVTDNTLTWKTQ
jgi:alpha-N-acetylglucosamine transferase